VLASRDAVDAVIAFGTISFTGPHQQKSEAKPVRPVPADANHFALFPPRWRQVKRPAEDLK
jgi:hypothetical protein